MKTLDDLRKEFLQQTEDWVKENLTGYNYVEIEIKLYDKKPEKVIIATINSDEKRDYIKNLLTSTELDLSKALEQEKDEISHKNKKYFEIFYNLNKFSQIDEESKDLFQLNVDFISKLEINYDFIDDIEECDKFEISREIRKNNTIIEIEDYLLNELIKEINSKYNNIQIYRLISSIRINKIENRQWLIITSRFKK
jgi:hypothetical protein